MDEQDHAAVPNAPRTPHAGNIEALLVRYMARVIDVNGVAYVQEGISHDGIDFDPNELAYLKKLEQRAREQYDL
jgi:hypothetical protein